MVNQENSNNLNAVLTDINRMLLNHNILLQTILEILVERNVVDEQSLELAINAQTSRYINNVRGAHAPPKEEELNSLKSTLFNPTVGIA